MFSDARFLNANDRKAGSLCLYLCNIDALAKKKYPDIKSNKERYTKFLCDELKKLNIDVYYRIEEKNKLVHLSEIIYEYFRCYFVHEADDRTHLEYEVQLEIESPGRFRFNGGILVDRIHEKFILKADWLINLLDSIIESNLAK